MLTSAEITIREFEEATALHDKCKTVCPMQEARVCAIDSISFRLHVFLNKCFMWGYNKCKNKGLYISLFLFNLIYIHKWPIR